MRSFLTLTIFLLFQSFYSSAQCPTNSRRGVHVVKANETLYAIARAYNVSVDQICTWNNISLVDRLSICKELIITQANPVPSTTIIPTEYNYSTPVSTTPITTTAPTTSPAIYSSSPPSNFANYRKQAGKQHTVQGGETFEGIAYLYGYTVPRFREINPLPEGHRVTPGSILLSTDCDCPRISYNGTGTNPTGTFTNTGNWVSPTTTNPTGGTSPFTNPSTTTNPTGGTTPFTNPPTTTNPVTTSPWTGGSVVGGNTGGTNPTSTRPTSNPNTGTGTSNPNPAPSSGNTAAANYMRPEERSMIDEMNLMRRNPRGYIPYVQAYVTKHKNDGFQLAPDYDNYVNSLISTLRTLSPLPEVGPKECLYEAAKVHGQDISRTGIFDHTGSDRSSPAQRINKACGGRNTSAENMGMGDTPRDAFMELLIDDGVPNLGHRINILNPEYKSFAAYRVDRVGAYNNVWVQTFSASPNVNSTASAGPSKGDNGSYMKPIEMDMVKEINLMRSNPRDYVKHVQKYVADRIRVWGQGPSRLYVDELINELSALGPLSQLETNQCIYTTARDHGESQKHLGDIQHKGLDGLGSDSRLRKNCGYLQAGGENLVAGKAKVRDAVIVLLIDEGISTRGHRKTLLNPNWRYVSCYRIGQVGTWNDYWVQNFGY